MNQVADIQINNDIAITIHKFETAYHKGPDGTLIETDVIHYSPKGDTKSLMICDVRRLSAVLPLDECGDNLAYIRAHRLWSVIEPNYLHWKKNNELPEHGIPLAAWSGVVPAQAGILKNAGLRSVEDIAEASDIVLGKTGLTNVLMLREQAQKYLKSQDATKASAQMTTLEEENRELKEQMAEMMAMMREMQSEAASSKKKKRKDETDQIESVEAAA